jgi:nicotinate-nucleotide adenylyltransferase
MMAETLGIFGGTFDPPHLGHLILAAEALSQLQLTRLLWVLTPQSPLKLGQELTALPHRLEMLKRAISATPGFELSTIEFERPGPHYTIDTLHLLQEKYPAAQLVLLVGGDSLHDLPAWGRPQEIIAILSAFGVMRRPNDKIDLERLEQFFPGLSAKLRFVDAPQLEISASTIRQRIASGGHFRYYLPASVYDYIQQNQLYR